MSKPKTQYICQECGAVYSRPQGQCYHCQSWNTITEEIIQTGGGDLGSLSPIGAGAPPTPVSQIASDEVSRIITGFSEFDRVTGGGIVPGSLVLIGGSPGIGKSTLLLSAADLVASRYPGKVLYISGEESLSQIKMRADRLGVKSDELTILSEVDMGRILQILSEYEANLVIIDSIQTMVSPALESAAGSVSQVRECTALLQRFCKSTGVPVIVVGHVTRSGSIAGPMVLEHIVDAVLYFEGEDIRDYRILRALKNRFGSTQEIGLFSMQSQGMIGIDNPSEFFLSHRQTETSGSVVVPVLEGTRTLLIEIQALVTPSGFGLPARRCEGVSANRVTLLLAVMEKRARMQMGSSDVFVNVVGGVQIEEPAADLGIALAIASSLRDKPLQSECCVLGEMGLGGEIRGVSRLEERVREASRMGFEKIILPAGSINNNIKSLGAKLIGIENLKDAINEAFKT